MQFTPQQLAGAQRYGPRTRVGNWQEDNILEETKIAEFRTKREQGTLMLGRRENKLNTCQQQVPHSYSEDGMVHFGANIVLAHCESGGAVACDLWDEIRPDEFTVTVARTMDPVARSTFRIVPVAAKLSEPFDQFPDDGVLYYGQPFHLQCNESLLYEAESPVRCLKVPTFLASALKSQYRTSRISNKQSVFMTSRNDNSAVWVIDKVAGKDAGKERLLSQGTPVLANCAVIVRHRATRQALYSNPEVIESTEFGAELEATCFNHFGAGKRESLSAEARGTLTPMTNQRGEGPCNLWAVVTATNPEAGIDDRQLPPPMSKESLTDFLRETGVTSDAILQILRLDKAPARLARKDLQWALTELAPTMSTQFVTFLLDSMDEGNSALLSVKEFFAMLE